MEQQLVPNAADDDVGERFPSPGAQSDSDVTVEGPASEIVELFHELQKLMFISSVHARRIEANPEAEVTAVLDDVEDALFDLLVDLDVVAYECRAAFAEK